jgi:transmembrane sensor
MLDEDIEEVRRRMQPPWDHLRERRVLRGVERGLEQRQARRVVARRALAAAALVATGVVLAVLAYVAGVDVGRKLATGGRVAPVSAAGSMSAPEPMGRVEGFDVFESRGLADGTLLDLSPGARVDVRTETAKRVEVLQSAGYARYDVPPRPGRAFVVLARGVRVQVKGTRFVVGVDAGKVSVKVERGLVHVLASSGEVELGAGDELSTSGEQAAAESADPDAGALSNGAAPPRAAHPSPGLPPSAQALLERADAERRSGDLAAAAATLQSVVGRYPNDRRAALAWFTLGKVERAREHAVAGAKAFGTSFSLAPDGPLGEDALAEEAAAWAAANEPAEARATAEQYLRRFPNGTHAARMQRIVE